MEENFINENYNFTDNNYGIELYIKELLNIPILSDQEKKDLPLLISKGNQEAKKRFIEGNLRLVIFEVNNFTKNYIVQTSLYEDLISVGNEALIKAVENFDYKKEIQFSTYAIKTINNELYTYYAENIFKFRCSHRFYQYFISIKEYLQNEKLNNKSYTNINDISKVTGINYKTICIIFDILKPLVYLDKEVNEDTENTMADLIEDKSIDFYEEDLLSPKYLHEFLKAVVNSKRINAKELKILLYRNGFYNNRIYLLKELSEMYNITSSGVNSIYKSTIKKLLRDPEVLKYAPDSYKYNNIDF